MDNSMNLVYADKVKALENYYDELGKLTLIGANDSMGVNLGILGMGQVTTLAKHFKEISCPVTTIDCCSMTINKIEHVDQMLLHNLTKKEIRLSQYYGLQMAIEKVMKDIHFPCAISKLAFLVYPFFKPKKEDSEIFLTDTIRESKEPTFIYTTGANNIMREVRNNPAKLQVDYKKRNITPNYNYTLVKCNDPKVLSVIGDGIKRNIEHILTINSYTDIYALNIYLPTNLFDKDGANIFTKVVDDYNNQLQKICDNYNVSYIDQGELAKKYCRKGIDFHLNREGHSALSLEIVNAMYERKIGSPSVNKPYISSNYQFNMDNAGSLGMAYDAVDERNRLLKRFSSFTTDMTYEDEQLMAIAKERNTEAEVFTKVMDYKLRG